MDSVDRNRKRLWKDEQRAAARAAFPLSSEVLQKLFNSVDSALGQNGCDHTLHYAGQWLAENICDPAPTLYLASE